MNKAFYSKVDIPNAPKVSIVIPHYNKELYIARALKSVLVQTIQDFEVIVVDDGPSDEGAAIVKGFGDPRIRLIQGENKGVSAARNRGIEEARSELVAFLDADDEWLPSFLEAILHLRILYPNAGLYDTAYEMHFPGAIVQKVYNGYKGEQLISSYFGACVKFGSLIFYPSASAAPKEVLIEMGGFPLGVKWGEDAMLWGKIALRYPVAYCPKVCAIYHTYTANSSTGIREYVEHPFIQYLEKINKEELLKRDDAEELLAYSDLCRIIAIQRNIYAGYGKRARSELISITSKQYKLKKYKLMLFSYIPSGIMVRIRNNARALSYMKHKLYILPKSRINSKNL